MSIRRAAQGDVSRIAEIYVFNHRINFYPIFRDDGYAFGELQVVSIAEKYLADRELLENTFVFDDGVVRGYIRVRGGEVEKLFVDPFFQSRGIGAALLEYACGRLNADHLWALEKNARAIRFYERHGFALTGERKHEPDTTEYLVRMRKSSVEPAAEL